MKQQKIVITGGPGTGKSSLIDQLTNMEFTCMPEISRTITRKARESGIDQLFLEDPLQFSEMLLFGRIDQYRKADAMECKEIFFDRGIPDIHGYLDYKGTPYTQGYIEKSLEFRYTHIFMMPPWEKIYRTDDERYESFEESSLIYSYLLDAYSKMNYDIITVPQGSVDTRIKFILNSL